MQTRAGRRHGKDRNERPSLINIQLRQTDYSGCHIFLRDHTVEDVDALLTAALGEPPKRRDGQPGLEPMRIYNKQRVGVSLLIVGKDKGRVDRLSRLAFAMKGHFGKR